MKVCRKAEEPAALSETPTAMGAQSPNRMSKEESISIFERWDLYPQGYRGQKESKDLQDWEMSMQRGTSRFLPLCCDRTSNVDVSHLIYLDEFVHRDF